MQRQLGTMLACATLLACGNNRPASEHAETSAPVRAESTETAADRLTFAQALTAASERYPEGIPIEVEIEEEAGRELLEVEFLVADGIMEVYLDPQTGEIVKETEEELDEAERATLPALRAALESGEVTLAETIRMALEQYDAAEIREIELEMHADQLVMEVALTAGADRIHDPKTGAPLGEETEEDHGAAP